MSTASSGQQVTDSLNGKLTFEQDKNRIVGRDQSNLIRMLIEADGERFRMRISESGIDVLGATPQQIIFDTNDSLFSIIAKPTVVVAPLLQPAHSSGSTSVAVDLTPYPANAVILPMALVPGQPSFLWQGTRGLTSTVVTGTAGWEVVAEYATTYTGPGQMQLSRTVINASSSSWLDDGYTITIYVLQETIA